MESNINNKNPFNYMKRILSIFILLLFSVSMVSAFDVDLTPSSFNSDDISGYYSLKNLQIYNSTTDPILITTSVPVFLEIYSLNSNDTFKVHMVGPYDDRIFYITTEAGITELLEITPTRLTESGSFEIISITFEDISITAPVVPIIYYGNDGDRDNPLLAPVELFVGGMSDLIIINVGLWTIAYYLIVTFIVLFVIYFLFMFGYKVYLATVRGKLEFRRSGRR